MSRVADTRCLLLNTIPTPRVLQNQLDRNLESYVAITEHRFLKELQNAMLHGKPHKWIAIFIAVVITLHTRETDIWRLEHWVLHPEVSYKWRHPETATTLIRKSVHQSNLLLNHLHVAGDVPRELYNIEQSLKTSNIKKANIRYAWVDEGSIDLSLSSLAFPSANGQAVLADSRDFGC